MTLAKRSTTLKTIGWAAMLAGLVALAAPVTAQESDALTCRRFDIAPAQAVVIPGDHALVFLRLADGTEVSFADVRDGDRLTAPGGIPIVTVLKCDVPAGSDVDSGATTITPTPEVVETPVEEPTPEVVEEEIEEPAPEVVEGETEEPTPEVVEEETEEPTPEVVEEPVPETPEVAPTPAPEEDDTPEVVVLPAEPTGPAPEVLPSVIERETELALTGVSSGWIAAMGAALLAAGGAMVVGSNAVARREAD